MSQVCRGVRSDSVAGNESRYGTTALAGGLVDVMGFCYTWIVCQDGIFVLLGLQPS